MLFRILPKGLYTTVMTVFICEFIIICLANDLKTEHFMLVPALIQKDNFTFTLLTSPGYSYSMIIQLLVANIQYSMSVFGSLFMKCLSLTGYAMHSKFLWLLIYIYISISCYYHC